MAISSFCCFNALSTVCFQSGHPGNADKLSRCNVIVETDGLDVRRHPFRSLILGGRGPYVPFPSHSFVSYLGPHVYMLLLDCRFVTRRLSAAAFRD